MGHRNLFSTSQMFGNDQNQNWNNNHVEQPYTNLAGVGASENASIFFPMENMSVEGVHFGSQWNTAPIPNGHITSSHNIDVSHYQPDLSGPLHVPFGMVPENLGQHSSSSYYDGQTFHGINGSIAELTMGNGRGPYKRKSPGVPSARERGSVSLNYSAGSSSGLPSFDLQQEKPTSSSQCIAREHYTMPPSYQGNLSLGAEGLTRNVRSRPALDLESNIARTHLSRNHLHHAHSPSQLIDHSSSVDCLGQGFGDLTNRWRHASASPGRIIVPGASGFGHEPHLSFPGHRASSTYSDTSLYHHDFTLNRNPVVSSGSHDASTQSTRGAPVSYPERSTAFIRPSSTNLRLGHEAASDESLYMVAEGSSSRHPRQLPSMRRNSDRTGRSRALYERYRSLSIEAGLHNRMPSEGFVAMDRAAFYGSRNMIDQHRDMMLDIDNMSYEELLALGERIGNVNTGLSEDLISKSLTAAVYCPDRIEQGICTICLEEYKDMNDVTVLKSCGHDYHFGCVKKWLSMKNSCPICKASVLPDNMKTG